MTAPSFLKLLRSHIPRSGPKISDLSQGYLLLNHVFIGGKTMNGKIQTPIENSTDRTVNVVPTWVKGITGKACNLLSLLINLHRDPERYQDKKVMFVCL